MKKNILYLLVMVVLSVNFIACGDKSQSVTTENEKELA